MSNRRLSIDCDVHAQVPGVETLMPYFDDYWQEMIVVRGIEGFEGVNYPAASPLTCREDWRGDVNGGDAMTVARRVLDERGVDIAIVNCLYGVQLIHDDFMAAAFARAVNDWVADKWLSVDPRFRASIVVAPQNPQLAVEEIERRAGDPRFVQVLLLASGDMPFGRSIHWPIYAAAQRHGLPIGIHSGSAFRQALTCCGWPSYHVESYVDQSQALQAQVASMVTHGVFKEYPDLKVVLIESGVSWMPAFLWRLTKFWKGVRIEAPWLDRPPSEVVREHFHLTLQPFDTPQSAPIVQKVLDHLGSDHMLLYASDYPHWQFDGDQVVPEGISETLTRKIFSDNPLAVYKRIGGSPDA